MSFRNAIRRSRWGKDVAELIDSDHHFRKIKFNPLILFPYSLAVRIMDPFDWAVLSRPMFLLEILLIVIAIILAVVFRSLTVLMVGTCVFIVLMYPTMIMGGMNNAVVDFLRGMARHLDVKEVKEFAVFSPSQLEDKCLERLRQLAIDIEVVEKLHPMPLSEERAAARQKLRKAYNFFRRYGIIQRTDWSEFFRSVG